LLLTVSPRKRSAAEHDIRHGAALLPGGGWRLTRPTKPKQLTRQAQRRRARSRFMPGGGWRLNRPTKLKQQVR
ncbi:hypothetical protein, partial [Enterobacter hormaechei]|uniref:hypothetical protein n=1 Tax=Enterobacter hormaechei TaxID=158836 RepID=UPI0019533D31